jgi:hypothetical protein
MKKLSDYRIREENGKFYVETKVKHVFNDIRSNQDPVTNEGYFDVTDSRGNCIIGFLSSEFKNEFDTLEAAKEQIIKWCEEPKKPKYHYVFEFHSEIAMVRPESEPINGKYYITQSVPPMDITCPLDLSRADIEYLGKCMEEKENKDIIFINEALKINPLFYKLIEKYEERVKSGRNPKTIEKSYADLTLENFELTIKNKELEIQLHEIKKQTDRNIEEMKQKRGAEKRERAHVNTNDVIKGHK